MSDTHATAAPHDLPVHYIVGGREVSEAAFTAAWWASRPVPSHGIREWNVVRPYVRPRRTGALFVVWRLVQRSLGLGVMER